MSENTMATPTEMPTRIRTHPHHPHHLDPPRRALPDLRDRQTGRLTELLERRPDLRGTYPWADEVDELVRWSV